MSNTAQMSAKHRIAALLDDNLCIQPGCFCHERIRRRDAREEDCASV